MLQFLSFVRSHFILDHWLIRWDTRYVKKNFGFHSKSEIYLWMPVCGDSLPGYWASYAHL